MDKTNVRELQDVVIRFSGDSGDGMQLTGTLFSDTSALLGNGISTFPDYPAEIRDTVKVDDNTSENLQSAESRIRDTDMADEMTRFSKESILQQAATSMLAQAEDE